MKSLLVSQSAETTEMLMFKAFGRAHRPRNPLFSIYDLRFKLSLERLLYSQFFIFRRHGTESFDFGKVALYGHARTKVGEDLRLLVANLFQSNFRMAPGCHLGLSTMLCCSIPLNVASARTVGGLAAGYSAAHRRGSASVVFALVIDSSQLCRSLFLLIL